METTKHLIDPQAAGTYTDMLDALHFMRNWRNREHLVAMRDTYMRSASNPQHVTDSLAVDFAKIGLAISLLIEVS